MEERNIWAKIVAILIDKNLTIATMESCTGGGIANEITNISGASTILRESLVTYCNEAKINHGVSAKVIDEYTVYSMETAKEMAIAVKKEINSNIAIGVTGQLGRIDPANPVNKLNHVWFAISLPDDEVIGKEIVVPDIEREKQKAYIISHCAAVLYEMLKK